MKTGGRVIHHMTITLTYQENIHILRFTTTIVKRFNNIANLYNNLCKSQYYYYPITQRTPTLCYCNLAILQNCYVSKDCVEFTPNKSSPVFVQFWCLCWRMWHICNFYLRKKCMHQNKILSRLKAAVLKSLHQLLNHPATCAYLHTFFAHFLACVNAYANTCTKMHKNGKKEKCMQQFCHKKILTVSTDLWPCIKNPHSAFFIWAFQHCRISKQ